METSIIQYCIPSSLVSIQKNIENDASSNSKVRLRIKINLHMASSFLRVQGNILIGVA